MSTAYFDVEPVPSFAPWNAADNGRLPDDVQFLLEEYAAETRLVQEQLQETFAELEQCRERLRDDELALRRERCELAELRAQLAQERAERELAQLDNDHALRQSVVDLQRERGELELELENVRQRAVELGDELSELKRTSAEERETWQTEIRQFRKSLEKTAQHPPRPVEHHPETTHDAATKEHAKPATAPGTYDPVLGSVLNQFQALQKDLARRRQPKTQP